MHNAWNRGTGIRGSTFSYDALGRRVTESDASNSQYFYYNGVQMIENAPQSGSSVRHQQFVYGLAYIDQVILRDRDADNSSGTGSLGATGSGLEERLYYTHNREYSVTGLISQTGTIEERTAYDPYGGIQYFTAAYGSGTSTSAYANTVGFTGRWKDPTGMWYFRARYEDPVLGRFIERDSKEYVNGMSLYCGYFVPNGQDPTGFCKDCREGLDLSYTTAAWQKMDTIDKMYTGFSREKSLSGWVDDAKRHSDGVQKYIRKITLYGHSGSPGYVSLGYGDDQMVAGDFLGRDPKSGDSGLEDKIRELKPYFCSKCQIVIFQCQAGRDAVGTSALTLLAFATGCTVTGYNDYVSDMFPSLYDDNRKSVDPWGSLVASP